MITDLILAPLVALAEWIVGLLPDAQAVDGATYDQTGVVGLLEKVNSIVPIGPAVGLAVGVLSALVAFVTIRAVLTVWHLVWP